MTIPDGTRVLVVDDEPVVLDVSVSLLSGRNLEVQTAMSVAEAMAAIDAAEPALLLVDKNLPDGSGLEVLAHLRETWPDAQAIVFTGFPSFDSAVEALRLGASDYIVKPLRDISELWHKARLALERRVLLQERERTLHAMEEAMRLQKLASHSESMAELGRMMAGLVHELRSPLTYVLGNVEVVLAQLESGRVDPEQAKESLEDAIQGIERISGMIHEVRDLSRVDAHDQQHLEDLSLDGLVESAVSLTRGQVQGRVRVLTEVPPGLWVRGARVRLLQVAVNLILNAVEAMDHVGQVCLRGRLADGEVVLEVEDDGPGIPSEVRDHLFDPFFTTKAAGTGLGLALCREIVEQHQGTIQFDSRLGEGTRFEVRLPAVAAPGEVAA